MKKFSLLLFIISAFVANTNAQNVAINADGSTANASAILDVKSTNKGILISRMTAVQRTAIPTPATGLMVYDTDSAAFSYYNGTAWVFVKGANNSAGSLWLPNGNHIYNANTANVGIGTNTPQGKLQVVGKTITDTLAIGTTLNANVYHPLQFSNIGGRKISLYNEGNNDHQYDGFALDVPQMRYQIYDTSVDHAFYAGKSPAASDELMRIKGNGNVGIGTSTPTEKLDVAGKTKTTNLQVTNGAAPGLVLTSDAVGNATWQTSTSSNAWNLTGNAGTNTTNFVGTTDAQDLRFKVNNKSFGYLGNVNKNVSFGENANTNGSKNISIGTGAFGLNTTNTNTIAIGDSALYKASTYTGETYNIAIGSKANMNNETGSFNLVMGYEAMMNNKFASSNTAIGFRSMYNTGSVPLVGNEGKHNTAVGDATLLSTTTGQGNTALGFLALTSNETGSSNVALGRTALGNNTTGNQNIAIGRSALFNSQTGNGNIAIGRVSLLNSNGKSGNVAIGDSAALNNGVGSSNSTEGSGITALGNKSLFSNTIGYNNTAIGYNADVLLNNLTNATAIGYNAKVGADNSLILGGTGADAVNVGIGTTDPSNAYLHGGSNRILEVVNNGSAVNSQSQLMLSTDATTGGSIGGVNLVARNSAIGDKRMGFIGSTFNAGGGNLLFYTNNGTSLAERLQINNVGAFAVNTSYGTAGQVLTSNGAGAAASWQNPSGSGGYWSANGSNIYNNNAGNVGIGTNNPTTASLVIGGSPGPEGIDLSTADKYANMRVIRNSLNATDKDMFIGYQSGAVSSLHLYSNNNETVSITGDAVGIGTNNVAGTKLSVLKDGANTRHIGVTHSFNEWFPQGIAAGRFAYMGYGYGGSQELTIMNEKNNNLNLGTNGTTRLTINNVGAMGVAGSFGNTNQILTSNGSGSSVSWKSAGQIIQTIAVTVPPYTPSNNSDNNVPGSSTTITVPTAGKIIIYPKVKTNYVCANPLDHCHLSTEILINVTGFGGERSYLQQIFAILQPWDNRTMGPIVVNVPSGSHTITCTLRLATLTAAPTYDISYLVQYIPD